MKKMKISSQIAHVMRIILIVSSELNTNRKNWMHIIVNIIITIICIVNFNSFQSEWHLFRPTPFLRVNHLPMWHSIGTPSFNVFNLNDILCLNFCMFHLVRTGTIPFIIIQPNFTHRFVFFN